MKTETVEECCIDTQSLCTAHCLTQLSQQRVTEQAVYLVRLVSVSDKLGISCDILAHLDTSKSRDTSSSEDTARSADVKKDNIKGLAPHCNDFMWVATKIFSLNNC